MTDPRDSVEERPPMTTEASGRRERAIRWLSELRKEMAEIGPGGLSAERCRVEVDTLDEALWALREREQPVGPREYAQLWRNDALESAALIAERYSADPWIARDIRAMIRAGAEGTGILAPTGKPSVQTERDNYERGAAPTRSTEAPKHVLNCDEYHAHTRIGIKFSFESRCCAANCPGCAWEQEQPSTEEAGLDALIEREAGPPIYDGAGPPSSQHYYNVGKRAGMLRAAEIVRASRQDGGQRCTCPIAKDGGFARDPDCPVHDPFYRASTERSEP